MKLIQELKTLSEAVTAPAFILLHHNDNMEIYEVAIEILKRFGYHDVGPASDFVNDDHSNIPLDDIVVFAAKAPSKEAVTKAIKSHDLIMTVDLDDF